MNKVSEILSYITEVAPLHWQESYDNSGLLIGDENALVDKALLTLDLTEQVVDEAIENSFHLIISHHPLIFKGLKNILVDNTIGRIVTKAIKNDISIAAMHTNLDNSYLGVNRVLAENLGLKELQILHQNNSDEDVQIGSGMVGMLENEMSEKEFLGLVKERLQVPAIRHSELLNKPIRRVALCGGSGSFLINDAKHCKADVYITADIKYHDFFNADNEILIIDAGHFETEQFTKQLFADIILKKNPNFAVQISSVKTNSVHYFV
ncbi:MAG: Nif3-like dinuclear metal center hexameric protein [Bacteroidales bacterium]|nr:Nif3-like dinuclear metal center hexameric protein [Bacteroidales bacterium]